MSNRNVEMLTALLRRITGDGERVSAGTEWLACRLIAEGGVLVPEALTAEDFPHNDLNDHRLWIADCPLCGDDLTGNRLADGIANLERIAKGET